MESPSKKRTHLDLPTSGRPPVFSLAPTTPKKHSKGDVSPATENLWSLWFHKPGPQRLSQAQIDVQPILPSEDDVELGGEGVGDAEKKMICGCGKANFIVIVFFMIVLLAAAVGGGVGGSLFAAKRDEGVSVQSNE